MNTNWHKVAGLTILWILFATKTGILLNFWQLFALGFAFSLIASEKREITVSFRKKEEIE